MPLCYEKANKINEKTEIRNSREVERCRMTDRKRDGGIGE